MVKLSRTSFVFLALSGLGVMGFATGLAGAVGAASVIGLRTDAVGFLVTAFFTGALVLALAADAGASGDACEADSDDSAWLSGCVAVMIKPLIELNEIYSLYLKRGGCNAGNRVDRLSAAAKLRVH